MLLSYSLALTLLALLELVGDASQQEALVQDISPRINFINVQAGSPTITITFKAPTLNFQTPLQNFWLKFEVPFSTSSLGPPIWATTTTCCDFTSMTFSPTVESYAGTSGNYSVIYVQLVGSTFVNANTYVIQLVPQTWISSPGYTEYLKLSIVSQNSTSPIVYAYNNNFMNFFASAIPSNNLLVQDATVDVNRFSVNQVIDSYLVVNLGFSSAQRIILQTTGDYTFTTNADTTCGLVADATLGITAPAAGTVSCGFWESLGPSKKTSLVFVWNNGVIPAGQYKLKFRLNTPGTNGDYHLSILTMAKYYPYIFLKKEYKFIFSATTDTWATGFPKMYYSMGLDASNTQVIDQVGLYSMGLGYHKAFNYIRIMIMANTNLLTLKTGQTYSLDIFIGDTTAILPLGYVYDTLLLAPGFQSKNITFRNGTLTFNNLLFNLNQVYTIGFRVGFINPQSLPTDSVRGFGTCVLRVGSTLVLKGRALMRPRFNNVKYNPGAMTTESIDRTDSYQRRHRGCSGFRTAASGTLTTPTKYQVNTGTHGLRLATGQNFWFQSSMGPNPLYYGGTLPSTHNGNRMYIDVITHSSIKPAGPTDYSDAQANFNCQVYSQVYSSWITGVNTAGVGNVVSDTTKYGSPAPTVNSVVGGSANFIGGCHHTIITFSGSTDTYSRFRMRFQDQSFIDSNSITRTVRAKDMAVIDDIQVKTAAGAQGNYYVWNNIQVSKWNSLKPVDSDTVILDAFTLLYFFGDTQTTTNTITVPPDVFFMDNMYVITADDTSASFPISVSVYASLQHMWMYDTDPNPTKWSVTLPDTEAYPVVLHFYGTLNNLPTTTKYIMIFFDFLEILVNNIDTGSVGCAMNGPKVKSCTYGKGFNTLTEQVYQSVAGNAGYSYITSRSNSYLLLEVASTEVSNFQQDFSLIIPVKPFNTPSISKLITLYSGSVVLNPVFATADQNWNLLEWVEFGQGAKFLKTDTNVYNPSYQIASLYATLEVPSSQVRLIDDGTANNSPNNVLWISPSTPTSTFTIGAVSDGLINSICTSCTQYSALNTQFFSTGLICGAWNMGADPGFAINFNAADNKLKPSQISYFNSANLLKYCLYIPSLLTSTNTQDANVKTYVLNKFTVPNYSGVKWPSDMLSIVSSGKVLAYLKPQSLNTQSNPNQILLTAPNNALNLIQTYNSAQVTLSFQMSNSLPKGGVIFFGITAGCEGLLTINGEDGTPPCLIRVKTSATDTTTPYQKCIYSINTGGFQVELQQPFPMNGDITMNLIEIIIYGLSIKKATISNVCNFVIRSYLSIAKNPLLVIDQSTTNLLVTYTTPADPLNPSGSSTIVAAYSDNNQVTAYSNINYRVKVNNRNIFRTDYLSMNLGALKYDTDDNPVWCAVVDPTTGNYLPEFVECLKDNLGLVAIKAYKDLSYSELNVTISGIINPIASTPGAVAEYYINEGFLVFSSPANLWSSLVNYGKFRNALRAWTQFDYAGIKTDLFVSLIPDYTVKTTNVFYLYFSPQYLTTLSKYNIYVYLSYLAPGTKTATPWTITKIWNINKRMLAVTGWASPIPASSNITLWIVGIDNPVTTTNRVVQLSLGYEKQYSQFLQWDFATFGTPAPVTGINLVNVETLIYDSLIIRENTRITLQFSVLSTIPSGSFILVTLNYLGDEIVKQFKPFCFMTLTSQFSSISKSCYMIGNRVEVQTSSDLAAQTSYTFIMDDIPNPDFGYVEPAPIIIMIVSQSRQKVLALSTELVINYQKQMFLKRDLTQLLDFSSITGGVLQVPQGFYKQVTISPVVLDAAKDSPFYLDTVTYALGTVAPGTVISKTLAILGITKFVGQIGTSGATLIVGANRTCPLTTYPVQVTLKQASGSTYTQLPLLRVQVIPVTMTIQGITTLDVYIGARSIPIQLSITDIPTSPIVFDILFLSGTQTGKIGVANQQQQFSLSENLLSFFLQIEAFDKTITPGTIPVTIRPALASSNFNDKVINLNFIAAPASLPALTITLTTTPVSADFYTYSFKVQSNQPSFVYLYAIPDYLFTEKTKDTVKAWALNGLTNINGSIAVGSAGIITPNVDNTILLTGLLADTTYKMVVFAESTTSTTVSTQSTTFATRVLSSKNGIMTMTFANPAGYESRIKVLCILAKKYSLSLDSLYSQDGLNCDTSLIPSYVLDYHKKAEVNLNDTKIAPLISKMTIFGFQSKQQGQNPAGLTNLRTATTLPGAVNVFSLYLNGVVRLTDMTPMGDFFETKPTLSTSYSVAPGPNSATVTGLTFTGVTGFIFAVASPAEEMSSSLTIADIRTVSKFASFYWLPVYSSPSDFKVTFANLTSNINYKASILATSDDPRSGAAYSSILNITFKTGLPSAGSILRWAWTGLSVWVLLKIALS